MTRRKINIMCLQETKWVSAKARKLDTFGFKLWYTGKVKNRNGVGIIVDKQWKKDIVDVKRAGDRIISIKLVVEGGKSLTTQHRMLVMDFHIEKKLRKRHHTKNLRMRWWQMKGEEQRSFLRRVEERAKWDGNGSAEKMWREMAEMEQQLLGYEGTLYRLDQAEHIAGRLDRVASRILRTRKNLMTRPPEVIRPYLRRAVFEYVAYMVEFEHEWPLGLPR
ncbi:uncharacterized protein LOC127741506 [Arachis duranensis]|uniref:Uncharacterized protein LOC127741506 n=1 Tax=Arachis duranensis TaxID=130453 RepID=A0A9C6T9Z6_ARADU|nr:uncharacterized protein LOC127741506 [Arachis duranensis]